ncbi:M20/M25/M40 family metallo-hydrolase [Shewanella sp. AS16]|uniref:M20/M25/M40 family metallo-hydrolase n=1 Tax=Shewanella sp. AS16 TaxID=2907625 RepID=UPI001F19EF67|nr:M20/M25/M40 family metallo-hydrolase [Shewanella sp. AS16]MCE9685288.1 M20/M25/M40 family metallo-hydrolase [Shewanella sp. AS16]
MKHYRMSLLASLLAANLFGCQVQSSNTHNAPQAAPAPVALLQQQALASDLGYSLVESLTVEVGPRLAGSDKDLVAVEWAESKLRELGFDRVYKEAVQVPVWNRGEAKASIVAPFPQPLVITALGGSVGTPEAGIQAGIVRFDSLAALQAANEAEVAGKIVFIDQKTERHITGEGYGKSVGGRSQGAVEAAKKGAVALVIRSIGTDHDRMPHTGMMHYQDDISRIPAAAMSAPDADLVDAMLARDPHVVLSLKMSPSSQGFATSYNVIAEVTGSSKPEEIVLLGAHLDSWDQGTGAIDDGAGVAIVTAAAKLIQDLPQKPARTVRVVLFAAEEIGLLGGKAYIQAHKQELAKHYMAAESDFGAGKIYRMDVNVAATALDEVKALAAPMANNGVAFGDNGASGGSEVSMLPAQGVPVASPRQDGTDYFDYHHTPNDTLDKIDAAALAQNIAAYAQFAYLMADSRLQLRPILSQDAQE